MKRSRSGHDGRRGIDLQDGAEEDGQDIGGREVAARMAEPGAMHHAEARAPNPARERGEVIESGAETMPAAGWTCINILI